MRFFFLLFRCFYKVDYWFTAPAFILGPLPTSLYWRAGTWERDAVPHNGMPGLTPNLLPISLVSMSLLLDAAQMLTPNSTWLFLKKLHWADVCMKVSSLPTLFLSKTTAVLPFLEPERKIQKHKTALVLQDCLRLVHDTNDDCMCFPATNLLTRQYFLKIGLPWLIAPSKPCFIGHFVGCFFASNWLLCPKEKKYSNVLPFGYFTLFKRGRKTCMHKEFLYTTLFVASELLLFSETLPRVFLHYHTERGTM